MSEMSQSFRERSPLNSSTILVSSVSRNEESGDKNCENKYPWYIRENAVAIHEKTDSQKFIPAKIDTLNFHLKREKCQIEFKGD